MKIKSKDLNSQLDKLKKPDNLSWKAQIFDLTEKLDSEKFSELLLKKSDSLVFHDEMASQLKELFKIRNPKKKLSSEEQEKLYRNWLTKNDYSTYGLYVYYPWSERIVHIVGKEEFIELRTSRNKYKITQEEQELLSSKTIGVIGLSVGQSVAVTMAIERVFGIIRIADFDTLELTNLNRIRSGVPKLGLPKTTMVAREIAEIDPFLKVEVFDQGITEDNIDSFLGEGEQKLDLLIEECDSLDIKILARIKARAKQIPVIMDTSDRGMIDIERFDLEPEREILHGYVKDEQAVDIAGLSQKDRLVLVMDIVGVDKISSRLKASLLEVEQSLTTWPQLASSVVLGGAITTILVRDILLNKPVKSGRFYFDPEEQLQVTEAGSSVVQDKRPKELSFDELRELAEKISLGDTECFSKPSNNVLEDIIEHACHAPSGGNVQPWKWLWLNNTLYLAHDIAQSFSFLDYKNRGSLVGLGAALENLEQRAAHFGYNTIIKNLVDGFENKVVATINFRKNLEAKDQLPIYLGDNLKVRLTNRKKGENTSQNVERKVVERAEKIVENSDFKLSWLESPDQIDAISDVIGGMERIRILDSWGHRDFIAEARWTAEQAEETRTGVDLRTLELSKADEVGLNLIKDGKAIEFLRKQNRGQGLISTSRESVSQSSAIVLLYSKVRGARVVLEGGKIMERLWLMFNQNGVGFQPVSPSTFMFARLYDEDQKRLWMHEQISNLRKQYLKIFNLDNQINDIFLFRLFYAAEPKVKSLRKPLSDVFKIING